MTRDRRRDILFNNSMKKRVCVRDLYMKTNIKEGRRVPLLNWREYSSTNKNAAVCSFNILVL